MNSSDVFSAHVIDYYTWKYVIEDYAIFDRLPQVLRQAIINTDATFPSSIVRDQWQMHGVEATVRMIQGATEQATPKHAWKVYEPDHPQADDSDRQFLADCRHEYAKCKHFGLAVGPMLRQIIDVHGPRSGNTHRSFFQR